MTKPEHISNPDWEILTKKYDESFLIKKLHENYPIQYLIGNVEFHNSIIKVDERCFIPRFETEYFVEHLIEIIKKYPQNIKIIDICSGSGAIAISLAKEFPNNNIIAIEKSTEAISIARENSELNNVEINFINQDLFSINNLDEYDIVISNPPYISKEEPVAESTKYEPQIALYANDEGLSYYNHIINISSLNNKLIAFEIGMNQGLAIKAKAQEKYPNSNILIKQDLSGRDRYVFIFNN